MQNLINKKNLQESILNHLITTKGILTYRKNVIQADSYVQCHKWLIIKLEKTQNTIILSEVLNDIQVDNKTYQLVACIQHLVQDAGCHYVYHKKKDDEATWTTFNDFIEVTNTPISSLELSVLFLYKQK